MTGCTYDTGTLLAAERNDRQTWLRHERFLSRGQAPVVPAPVLVEAWRGGVQMARFLQGCRVEELDEAIAREAGMLLGRCSIRVEATDAVVVEGALRRKQPVSTSNRSHLEGLADGVHRKLSVIDV